MSSIFNKKYKFSTEEASNITPTAGTVSILQSLAMDHSFSVGYTPQWFSENSLAWFLIDWHIVFHSIPTSESLITGSTWSIGHRRSQAHRSFILTDENNKLVLEALSKWALINTSTRRPSKPSDEMMTRYGAGKEEIFTGETFTQELPSQNNLQSAEVLSVNSSHIDVNNHLNNGVYIGWHEDFVSQNSSKHKTLSSLRVHYYKEAYLHDSITHNLFCSDNSNNENIYVSQFIKPDDPNYIYCQITTLWR